MELEDAKQVLDWLSAYRKTEGKKGRLQAGEFAKWLSREAEARETKEKEMKSSPDGLISMYFGFMANYAAFYARRLFRHTDIYSMTDWAFLVTLQQQGEMQKSALIQHNILEKSSGTEVLKRLIRQGYITERVDPDDRRAKQVQLTESGRAVVEAANQLIYPMGKVVTGDLSPAEKRTLLGLLQRLHHFHQPIFEEKSEEQIADLLGLPGAKS